MNMWDLVGRGQLDAADLFALVEGMTEENRIVDEMIREACRNDPDWVWVVE